jgi:hypothetical protein
LRTAGRSEASLTWRAELYELRDRLREYLPAYGQPGGRGAGCGRVRVGGNVGIVERERRCHYVGLVRRGLLWTCPVCSVQIRAFRATQVQRVVAWHCNDQGHGAEGAQLVTVTVRHRYGDDLADLQRGLARAWREFQAGNPWLKFRERVGLVGDVRALEVTYGDNGWHPHLHTVFLVTRPDRLATEIAWLKARWQRCVMRCLGEAAEPDSIHGLDVRPCHKADYLTKLGLEITAPAGKRAAGKHRTPWDIARDLAELGGEEDRLLWAIWREDIKGRRMIGWSPGLREAAGIDEKSDEDIVAGEGPNDRDVAIVPGRIWDRIRERPGIVAQLLAVAEVEGARGVETFLASLETGPP